MPSERWTCQATGVVCKFPRNVWFLDVISGFGSQQGQWLTSFVSRTWSTYIGWCMIASVGRHSLYIRKNLVSQIWSLICIHVGCMSTTPNIPMGNMVLFKLLQRTWSCSPSDRYRVHWRCVTCTWVPIECRLWGCSLSRWHWRLYHYSWQCQGSLQDLGSFHSST